MRETHDLEFKEGITNTFLKTVSAFANYGTGRILFGVTDAGKSVGLEDPTSDALRIENMINDAIDPVPHFTLSLDKEERTICLTVFEGAAKPYLLAKKAYRRADSATVEVDRVEFGRLVLAGQNMAFDELTSRWTDFSFSLLSKRFMKHLGLTTFDDNALRTLGLISANGDYTNAAEILSDRNGLPGVDIVKFGDSINVLLDRKTVVGKSVLEQYDAALEMYERYCVYDAVSQAARERVELIPFEAYREAVANALVHRVWDTNANVTISMYSDRITVVSPGGLPNGVSPDEYLGGGISIPRNPLVANVFFRLNYIEQFGTGITRINEAYSSLATAPLYDVRNASLSITLPFAIGTLSGLTLDESVLLSKLSRTLLLSRKEIEHASGFNKDKTTRILNALVSRRLVEKTGAGRGTRYRKV